MLARPKNVAPNKSITPELHCFQDNVIFDTFHITPFTSVGEEGLFYLSGVVAWDHTFTTEASFPLGSSVNMSFCPS